MLHILTNPYTSSFLRLPLHRIILIKLQTNTIDTMPLIRRRRISLPLKHMSQMPSTITAHNLDPLHAKRLIRVAGDSSRHGIEKSRPTAAGLELVVGFVERGLAAGAGVDAGGRGVFVVLASEGGFGALLAEDAELLWISSLAPILPGIIKVRHHARSLPLLNCACHSSSLF